MEKRYTLPVAIALVVGTVIGSGVFFKAEAVLTKTGGNLSVGILAFIIMGVVMIISACTFGVVAQSHEGVEGLVGYAAASCGKTYKNHLATIRSWARKDAQRNIDYHHGMYTYDGNDSL